MERERLGCLTVKGKRHYIYEGLNTIGRDKQATVIVRDLGVSHQHAIITIVDEERHFISDFKSSNGTHINDQKLVPFKLYEINDGSVVFFSVDVEATYKKISRSEVIGPEENDITENTQSDDTFYAECTQIYSINDLTQQNSNHFANKILDDGFDFTSVSTQNELKTNSKSLPPQFKKPKTIPEKRYVDNSEPYASISQKRNALSDLKVEDEYIDNGTQKIDLQCDASIFTENSATETEEIDIHEISTQIIEKDEENCAILKYVSIHDIPTQILPNSEKCNDVPFNNPTDSLDLDLEGDSVVVKDEEVINIHVQSDSEKCNDASLKSTTGSLVSEGDSVIVKDKSLLTINSTPFVQVDEMDTKDVKHNLESNDNIPVKPEPLFNTMEKVPEYVIPDDEYDFSSVALSLDEAKIVKTLPNINDENQSNTCKDVLSVCTNSINSLFQVDVDAAHDKIINVTVEYDPSENSENVICVKNKSKSVPESAEANLNVAELDLDNNMSKDILHVIAENIPKDIMKIDKTKDVALKVDEDLTKIDDESQIVRTSNTTKAFTIPDDGYDFSSVIITDDTSDSDVHDMPTQIVNDSEKLQNHEITDVHIMPTQIDSINEIIKDNTDLHNVPTQMINVTTINEDTIVIKMEESEFQLTSTTDQEGNSNHLEEDKLPSRVDINDLENDTINCQINDYIDAHDRATQVIPKMSRKGDCAETVPIVPVVDMSGDAGPNVNVDDIHELPTQIISCPSSVTEKHDEIVIGQGDVDGEACKDADDVESLKNISSEANIEEIVITTSKIDSENKNQVGEIFTGTRDDKNCHTFVNNSQTSVKANLDEEICSPEASTSSDSLCSSHREINSLPEIATKIEDNQVELHTHDSIITNQTFSTSTLNDPDDRCNQTEKLSDVSTETDFDSNICDADSIIIYAKIVNVSCTEKESNKNDTDTSNNLTQITNTAEEISSKVEELAGANISSESYSSQKVSCLENLVDTTSNNYKHNSEISADVNIEVSNADFAINEIIQATTISIDFQHHAKTDNLSSNSQSVSNNVIHSDTKFENIDESSQMVSALHVADGKNTDFQDTIPTSNCEKEIMAYNPEERLDDTETNKLPLGSNSESLNVDLVSASESFDNKENLSLSKDDIITPENVFSCVLPSNEVASNLTDEITSLSNNEATYKYTNPHNTNVLGSSSQSLTAELVSSSETFECLHSRTENKKHVSLLEHENVLTCVLPSNEVAPNLTDQIISSSKITSNALGSSSESINVELVTTSQIFECFHTTTSSDIKDHVLPSNDVASNLTDQITSLANNEAPDGIESHIEEELSSKDAIIVPIVPNEKDKEELQSTIASGEIGLNIKEIPLSKNTIISYVVDGIPEQQSLVNDVKISSISPILKLDNLYISNHNENENLLAPKDGIISSASESAPLIEKTSELKEEIHLLNDDAISSSIEIISNPEGLVSLAKHAIDSSASESLPTNVFAPNENSLIRKEEQCFQIDPVTSSRPRSRSLNDDAISYEKINLLCSVVKVEESKTEEPKDGIFSSASETVQPIEIASTLLQENISLPINSTGSNVAEQADLPKDPVISSTNVLLSVLPTTKEEEENLVESNENVTSDIIPPTNVTQKVTSFNLEEYGHLPTDAIISSETSPDEIIVNLKEEAISLSRDVMISSALSLVSPNEIVSNLKEVNPCSSNNAISSPENINLFALYEIESIANEEDPASLLAIIPLKEITTRIKDINLSLSNDEAIKIGSNPEGLVSLPKEEVISVLPTSNIANLKESIENVTSEILLLNNVTPKVISLDLEEEMNLPKDAIASSENVLVNLPKPEETPVSLSTDVMISSALEIVLQNKIESNLKHESPSLSNYDAISSPENTNFCESFEIESIANEEPSSSVVASASLKEVAPSIKDINLSLSNDNAIVSNNFNVLNENVTSEMLLINVTPKVISFDLEEKINLPNDDVLVNSPNEIIVILKENPVSLSTDVTISSALEIVYPNLIEEENPSLSNYDAISSPETEPIAKEEPSSVLATISLKEIASNIKDINLTLSTANEVSSKNINLVTSAPTKIEPNSDGLVCLSEDTVTSTSRCVLLSETPPTHSDQHLSLIISSEAIHLEEDYSKNILASVLLTTANDNIKEEKATIISSENILPTSPNQTTNSEKHALINNDAPSSKNIDHLEIFVPKTIVSNPEAESQVSLPIVVSTLPTVPLDEKLLNEKEDNPVPNSDTLENIIATASTAPNHLDLEEQDDDDSNSSGSMSLLTNQITSDAMQQERPLSKVDLLSNKMELVNLNDDQFALQTDTVISSEIPSTKISNSLLKDVNKTWQFATVPPNETLLNITDELTLPKDIASAEAVLVNVQSNDAATNHTEDNVFCSKQLTANQNKEQGSLTKDVQNFSSNGTSSNITNEPSLPNTITSAENVLAHVQSNEVASELSEDNVSCSKQLTANQIEVQGSLTKDVIQNWPFGKVLPKETSLCITDESSLPNETTSAEEVLINIQSNEVVTNLTEDNLCCSKQLTANQNEEKDVIHNLSFATVPPNETSLNITDELSSAENVLAHVQSNEVASNLTEDNVYYSKQLPANQNDEQGSLVKEVIQNLPFAASLSITPNDITSTESMLVSVQSNEVADNVLTAASEDSNVSVSSPPNTKTENPSLPNFVTNFDENCVSNLQCDNNVTSDLNNDNTKVVHANYDDVDDISTQITNSDLDDVKSDKDTNIPSARSDFIIKNEIKVIDNNSIINDKSNSNIKSQQNTAANCVGIIETDISLAHDLGTNVLKYDSINFTNPDNKQISNDSISTLSENIVTSQIKVCGAIDDNTTCPENKPSLDDSISIVSEHAVTSQTLKDPNIDEAVKDLPDQKAMQEINAPVKDEYSKSMADTTFSDLCPPGSISADNLVEEQNSAIEFEEKTTHIEVNKVGTRIIRKGTEDVLASGNKMCCTKNENVLETQNSDNLVETVTGKVSEQMAQQITNEPLIACAQEKINDVVGNDEAKVMHSDDIPNLELCGSIVEENLAASQPILQSKYALIHGIVSNNIDETTVEVVVDDTKSISDVGNTLEEKATQISSGEQNESGTNMTLQNTQMDDNFYAASTQIFNDTTFCTNKSTNNVSQSSNKNDGAIFAIPDDGFDFNLVNTQNLQDSSCSKLKDMPSTSGVQSEYNVHEVATQLVPPNKNINDIHGMATQIIPPPVNFNNCKDTKKGFEVEVEEECIHEAATQIIANCKGNALEEISAQISRSDLNETNTNTSLQNTQVDDGFYAATTQIFNDNTFTTNKSINNTSTNKNDDTTFAIPDDGFDFNSINTQNLQDSVPKKLDNIPSTSTAQPEDNVHEVATQLMCGSSDSNTQTNDVHDMDTQILDPPANFNNTKEGYEATVVEEVPFIHEAETQIVLNQNSGIETDDVVLIEEAPPEIIVIEDTQPNEDGHQKSNGNQVLLKTEAVATTNNGNINAQNNNESNTDSESTQIEPIESAAPLDIDENSNSSECLEEMNQTDNTKQDPPRMLPNSVDSDPQSQLPMHLLKNRTSKRLTSDDIEATSDPESSNIERTTNSDDDVDIAGEISKLNSLLTDLKDSEKHKATDSNTDKSPKPIEISNSSAPGDINENSNSSDFSESDRLAHLRTNQLRNEKQNNDEMNQNDSSNESIDLAVNVEKDPTGTMTNSIDSDPQSQLPMHLLRKRTTKRLTSDDIESKSDPKSSDIAKTSNADADTDIEEESNQADADHQSLQQSNEVNNKSNSEQTNKARATNSDSDTDVEMESSKPIEKELTDTTNSKQKDKSPLQLKNKSRIRLIDDEENTNSSSDFEEDANASKRKRPQRKLKKKRSKSSPKDDNKKEKGKTDLPAIEKTINSDDTDIEVDNLQPNKTPQSNSNASKHDDNIINDDSDTDVEGNITHNASVAALNVTTDFEDSFVKRRSFMDMSNDVIPATQELANTTKALYTKSLSPALQGTKRSEGSEHFSNKDEHCSENSFKLGLTQDEEEIKRYSISVVKGMEDPTESNDSDDSFDFGAPTQKIDIAEETIEDDDMDFIGPTQKVISDSSKLIDTESLFNAETEKVVESDAATKKVVEYCSDDVFDVATQKFNDSNARDIFKRPLQKRVTRESTKFNYSLNDSDIFIAATQVMDSNPVANNENLDDSEIFQAATQKADYQRPSVSAIDTSHKEFDDSEIFGVATQKMLSKTIDTLSDGEENESIFMQATQVSVVDADRVATKRNISTQDTVTVADSDSFNLNSSNELEGSTADKSLITKHSKKKVSFGFVREMDSDHAPISKKTDKKVEEVSLELFHGFESEASVSNKQISDKNMEECNSGKQISDNKVEKCYSGKQISDEVENQMKVMFGTQSLDVPENEEDLEISSTQDVISTLAPTETNIKPDIAVKEKVGLRRRRNSNLAEETTKEKKTNKEASIEKKDNRLGLRRSRRNSNTGDSNDSTIIRRSSRAVKGRVAGEIINNNTLEPLKIIRESNVSEQDHSPGNSNLLLSPRKSKLSTIKIGIDEEEDDCEIENVETDSDDAGCSTTSTNNTNASDITEKEKISVNKEVIDITEKEKISVNKEVTKPKSLRGSKKKAQEVPDDEEPVKKRQMRWEKNATSGKNQTSEGTEEIKSALMEDSEVKTRKRNVKKEENKATACDVKQTRGRPKRGTKVPDTEIETTTSPSANESELSAQSSTSNETKTVNKSRQPQKPKRNARKRIISDSEDDDLISVIVPKKQKNITISDIESGDDKWQPDVTRTPIKRGKKSIKPSNLESSTLLSTPERAKRKLKPKVVFTMFESPELSTMVRRLGGTMVDSIDTATVLVTKNVLRTQKLLCAVGQCKPICAPDWLQECKKANSFLDPWDFLIKDEEAEKKWKFSLRESYNRSKSLKLFEGYSFHLLVSKALDVLEGAIDNSGGKCVTKAPKTGNFIVIATEDNRKKCAKYFKQKVKVVLPEAIFDGVLRQEIVFDNHLLT